MLKTSPDPADVQDIQFKLHCRLKVFENKELGTFSKLCSLISCASRYGLLFVGSNSSILQVIQLKCLENYSPKDKEISGYLRRNVRLQSSPTHLCVNCDCTILAVVTEKDNCPSVVFYDVLSFLKQNISIIREVRLSSTPGTFVTEINWNPALPAIFTACKSDGTLGVYELKSNSVDINELPITAEATSFCWSPKGKQIAIGSKNGKIIQYKPDLKAVKVINQPPLAGPHSVISLHWVSNYQFIGIYQSLESDGTAKLLVVDAPKSGDVSYTNYEDVCYSGTARSPQFYMILQQQLNILMVASSNSTELGVLGSTGESWTQWIISDSARAELPLSLDHQETLPVGLALDISSTKPLPWGESSIPPCPYLLILSHQGVLCFFDFINLREGNASICAPPDPISDVSGISQFVTKTEYIPATAQTSKTSNPSSALSYGTSQKTTANQQLPFGMFGTKTTESQKIFVETTVTPIKPQQRTTQASLFGGEVTIMPVGKTQSSNPAAAPSDNKYSSIFSALSVPTSTTSQNKLIPISMSIATSEPVEEQPIFTLPKPNAMKSVDAEAALDERAKAESEAFLARMIKEECTSLESELKALLHQGKSLKINIGSETEKTDIITKMDYLQGFIKEIIDISIGESGEVHSLKQNLILSWAWYEEALSRFNSSKDETLTLLLRSQPLDSATEKKQTDINKLMYYLESQLSQASKALDEQWNNFQDHIKKTHRVRMPTMEAIFQAMVRQNAILQKQAYILKDIASRIRNKTRFAEGRPLLVSQHLTKDIEEDLKHLQDSEDNHQVHYANILGRTKNFSKSKVNKLRDLIKKREVLHVTVTKPRLSSSVQSPFSKSKQLISILGAQMSPVPNSAVPRNLDFMQSTPVRDKNREITSTKVPPNTPAQVDNKKFTFKNTDKSGTATSLSTTASNFLPLSKSISVFGNLPQGSAFVPTTQVTFGTKPAFPPITSISETPKSITPASVTLSATSNFPKFGVATAPKAASTTTLVSAAKVTEPTTASAFKVTASQFTFGSTAVTTANSTPVSAFNFGASSNLFGTKVNTDVSAPVTTKLEILKPTITVTPSFLAGSSTAFSFENSSGTPKASAFSAVTNVTPSSTVSTCTSGGSLTTLKLSTPSSINTNTGDGSLKSTPMFSTSTVSVTKPTSTDGKTSAVPHLLFGSTTTVSAVAANSPKTLFSTSTHPVANSGTALMFASPTTTTAKPSIFASTTTSSSSSSLFAFKTTDSGKPSIFDSSTSATTSIFALKTDTEKSSSFTFAAPSTATASIFNIKTVDSTKSIFSNTTKPTVVSSDAKTADSTKLQIFPTPTSTSVSTDNISLPIPKTTDIAKSSVFSTPTALPSFTNISLFSPQTTDSAKPSIVSTTVLPATSSGTMSIFTSKSPDTTKPSIFSPLPATSSGSIFSKSTAKPSIFGMSSPTSSTSAQSQTGSLFGASTTSTITTTKSSPFGKPSTTTQSVFGSGTPKTTQASIFGAATAIATTAPSLFGTTPTCTQQGSIFGGATTQASLFGTTANAPTTQPSIFGSAVSTSTTNSSTFGLSLSAPATQSSIFNVTSSAPSTQSSLFGSTSAASAPFGSVFGTTSASTPSPFSQSGSVFGTPKTTASVFGSAFGNSSVFGSTPAVTTNSVFGQSSPTFGSGASFLGTTTPSTSIFGSTTSGPTFGNANSSGNVFGSFGFGNLSVGNAATTSSSIFGGSATFGQSAPANPFSRTVEQKPAFGGSSPFGSPVSSSASLFGSNPSSTFGSSTQGGFGASTFGSSSTFGQQPTFGQSSFGNASFGSPQPGPFSGGVSGVGQTGFGSPTSFQKSSAFGAAPVFGGSPQPAFGASPSFGGAPAFGAAPTFGSPSKIFGSNTPTAAFGTATATAGFGNLANQNTVGFGNLAQQATTPTSTPFSGSSSFSSWR